jgi:TolB-like protein
MRIGPPGGLPLKPALRILRADVCTREHPWSTDSSASPEGSVRVRGQIVPDLLAQAKERRIWRVLLAYPSVTFVALEAVEFFIDNYGLDGRLLTSTLIAAVVSFPAAVLWNWRHGEAGRQEFRRAEIGAYGLFLSVAAVAVGWYWGTSAQVGQPPVTTAQPPRSIAVLPFQDLGEEDVQYLGDGVAEGLINWLASIPDVRVTAKTASFRLRDQAEDLDVLRERLGVSHAVVGTVQRVEDQLVIAASLVDLNQGHTLWGERLIRPADEALLMEQSIVSALADGLQLEMSGPRAAEPGGTDDPDAYDEYLRGHHLIQATDNGSIQRGLTRLRAAIALDPGFARPYAEISDALSQMIYYETGDPEELIDEARTAAYSAIAISPDLPEAQVALAAVHQYINHDWRAAEAAYEAAIAGSPNDPIPYHRYVDFLWATLRFEKAEAMAGRAIEIDPFDSNSMHAVGIARLFAGDFEGAAAAFGEWNEFHPESLWSYVKHAVALAHVGSCDHALSQARRADVLAEGRPDALMDSWMAWAYLTCGESELYRRSVARAEATVEGDWHRAAAAGWYVAALEGDVDGAIELLDFVVRTGSPYTLFLQVFQLDYLGWPVAEQIRTDPRYLALLRELDFPATRWSVATP